jgi:hypothetical protein
MATNWPGSRDTFTNPTSGDTLDSPSHAAQHANINDAVEAMQAHAGLVLVKPTSATNGTVGTNGAVTIGSGVSSVTVNGAFSSTYDAYKIIVFGGAGSTTAEVRMTLGASSTGYYNGFQDARYDGVDRATNGQDNAAYWYMGRINTDVLSVTCELIGPAVAKVTTIRGDFNDTRGLVGSVSTLYSGFHSVATAYTDFTLTLSTGTMTGGTIRVYGYNNG